MFYPQESLSDRNIFMPFNRENIITANSYKGVNNSGLKKGRKQEMSSAPFVKELYYLAFLTASLSFLPALKTGTLRAGIFKGFLVLGFIPLRALR